MTGWASGCRPAPPSSTSRSSACSRPARPTCRWTPTTPTSAPRLVSQRRASRGVFGPGLAITVRGGVRRRGARRAPGARRRRLDHLHLRLDRHAEGRGGHAPLRGGVRRRRGAAVPARASRWAPATGCWPGSRSRSTPPARRCGWPGGTAPAWSPRRARWSAAASTSVRGWSSSGITVVSTVPTLAALWPADALDDVRLLIFGGEACPPELVERLVDRRPRGLEHLRPHRGHRRRLRRPARPAGPGADRPAPGRLGAGRGRRGRRAGAARARSAS